MEKQQYRRLSGNKAKESHFVINGNPFEMTFHSGDPNANTQPEKINNFKVWYRFNSKLWILSRFKTKQETLGAFDRGEL